MGYDELLVKQPEVRDIRNLFRVGIQMTQGQGPVYAEILIVVPQGMNKDIWKPKLIKILSEEGSVNLTKCISIGTVYVIEKSQ